MRSIICVRYWEVHRKTINAVLIKLKKIAQVTGHKGSIFALSPGLESNHFISGAGEGWAVKWNGLDPDPGKLIARIESNIFSLFQSENALIAGDMNGGMHWINPEDGTSKSVQHHQRGVFDIWAYKEWIYALGGDGYLSRRSIHKEGQVESIQISHQALRCRVDIGPDRVAIGASDSNIYVVHLDQMTVERTIPKANEPSVFALAFDAEGKRLFSGGRDAQIRVWDVEGQPLREIPAHMFTVNALVYLPEMDVLVSGSRDKTIKIWNAADMSLIKVVEGIRDGGHLNSVNCLLWQADLQYLISGSDDKSIGIWSISKHST